MTLRENIEKHGYTIEEYNKSVDMLISKGVPNGCFQDYSLIMFIISLLTNLEGEMGDRS